nr:hypothetical protein [Tanacetum cinerariifolium]
MGNTDINMLTMEQYLALTRRNQAPSVVKTEIRRNVNFEIKSQFMRELREDTFSGIKMTMRAAKRWVDKLSLRTINTQDFLKNAFIQRYCPPSKTAKQLEEIHNFNQEGDKTLYQAWERKVSNDSSVGIAAITKKLDSLGRDMKKLKENVYAIQVGCEIYRGAHLNKECPPGYYTRMDNRPPFGEKKPSLKELMNKHIEESTRKRAKMEEWMKNLQESMKLNTRNQNTSIRNLETQIEQLEKDYHAKAANKVPDLSVPKETKESPQGVFPCQLPPKELNPISFTLPCTIESKSVETVGKKRKRYKDRGVTLSSWEDLGFTIPAVHMIGFSARNKMGNTDINILTMEQYLALTRKNQAPSDAVMLRVFPITLIGAAKRWVDKLSLRTINTRDLLKNAFIQRYCPPSKTAKQLEEIHNFNQEGPPRYYTSVDNRPPFSEKKASLKELMNKHIEESTRKREKMEEWMKNLQESMKLNTRNQNTSIRNLETQIEQLAKDYHAKAANEVPDLSVPKETKESPQGVFPCQLPPKELNPISFTLPCTIGSLNFYAMADLGASVNIMPRSMFNHLKLTNLKKTDMLIELVDMANKAPIGIVENDLVKINKSLFPYNFMLIDMLGDPNETLILGRPFLATIHARIDVFDKEISLRFGDDITFCYMNGKVHHPVLLVENACMISDVQGEESFNPLEIGNDLFSYEAKRYNEWCTENNNHRDFESTSTPNIKSDTSAPGRILNLSNQEDLILSTKSYFPNFSLIAMLNEWILDSFDIKANFVGIRNDPYSRSLDEHKAVFDKEIEQLANEYEPQIGKKGAKRYNEWCTENNNHRDFESTSTPNIESDTSAPGRILNLSNQEDLILSTKSYFPNFSLIAMLNEWILDSFDIKANFVGIRNDPYSRSLDEHKALFDKKIEQLANEYEPQIGKKGYVLDDIWEKCK